MTKGEIIGKVISNLILYTLIPFILFHYSLGLSWLASLGLTFAIKFASFPLALKEDS